MKTKYKILIFIAIVLLFLFSLFIALGSKKQESTEPGQTTSQSLSVPTNGGGSIIVNDITKSSQAILGDTDVIEQNENFSIVYFTKDQSFLITILGSPAQQYRNAAEQELLNKLQIQETDACKLNVSLTVPASVNQSLAGQDYGLSFCPAGKAFSVSSN